MKLNHNKIICIKLVHLLSYIYDARSHLYQTSSNSLAQEI